MLCSDWIGDIKSTTAAAAEEMSFVKSALETSIKEEERVSIRKWLHPDSVESEAHYKAALEQKHPVTGKLLLESDQFGNWILGPHTCMWLYGIGTSLSSSQLHTKLTIFTAGCGKTILSYV
jgi:hypothetical protein